jgi:hypothetical protein
LTEEQLPWTNFRCLKGWDKEVENVFDIEGVPANFLLEPDGNYYCTKSPGRSLGTEVTGAVGK